MSRKAPSDPAPPGSGAGLSIGLVRACNAGPTLAFFAGLFIMVGALVKVGVIQQLADAAADLTGGRLLLATTLLLWVSGLLSAVVDNIPYVATVAPVVGT